MSGRLTNRGGELTLGGACNWTGKSISKLHSILFKFTCLTNIILLICVLYGFECSLDFFFDTGAFFIYMFISVSIVYVVVNFLSWIIFVFLFCLGMVMSANKVETKDK